MNTVLQEQKECQVIQIPTRLNDSQIGLIEGSINRAREVKREYCDEVHEFITENLWSSLAQFGFDLNRLDPKSMIAVEQFLQAVLYGHYRIDHQFLNIAEQLINVNDGEEEPSGTGDIEDEEESTSIQ